MNIKAGSQNKKTKTEYRWLKWSFWVKLRVAYRDKVWNEGIRRDLQIFSLNNRILEYKHQWFQHVQWMENDRPPERAVEYRPKGRRTTEKMGWLLKLEQALVRIPWSEHGEDDDGDHISCLFQWYFSAPYGLVPRVAAWLACPLIWPWLAVLYLVKCSTSLHWLV
jgi:hypothetical protein